MSVTAGWRRVGFAACVLHGVYTVAGCGSSAETHPPQLLESGPSHPVVCDRLMGEDAGPVEPTGAGTFIVDGEVAECLVQGQECLLGVARWCDGGMIVARCVSERWQADCWSGEAGRP